MKNFLYIGFYLLIAALFATGCSSSQKAVLQQPSISQPESPVDDRYTSAFPEKDVSEKLSTIYRSVKRITITGVYRIFYFEDTPVTIDQIRTTNLDDLSTRSITKDESVAGTAISIGQNKRITSLLTCAHIVQFPDTLIEYISSDNHPKNTYIQSVAIKYNQRNLIYDDASLAPFEIKSVKSSDDLALIQVLTRDEHNLDIPPLPIKLGDSKKLKWGSFLYIAGYPKGAPVVTRGIVSSPNRSSRGDYFTDALFNHGMSGGIILASNDNFSSFEWVGIANTASAEQEEVLVPDPSKSSAEKLTEPYDGTIYREKKTRIAYGVTQSIPTADIRDFLEENRELVGNAISELTSF